MEKSTKVKTRELDKAPLLKKVISSIESTGKRIITTRELVEMLGVNKKYASVIISRLKKKRWLDKIKKGTYQIIPSSYGESLDVPIPSDPYIIASGLSKNYYLSHFSAAFFYGLTDQIPTTVFISTPVRYHTKIIGQAKFKFIYIPKIIDYGCEKKNYRGIELIVSDVEKTVIDVIDKPKYAGGMAIAYEIIGRAKDKVDTHKILKYCLMTKKRTLIQRLGYLTELAGYKWNQYEIEQMRKKISKNYTYLDCTAPKKQVDGYSSKWNLMINLPLRYVQGEKGVG